MDFKQINKSAALKRQQPKNTIFKNKDFKSYKQKSIRG